MGWGTDFKINIYLSKVVFNAYEELTSKISKLEEDILEAKKSIYMYSTSNPSDIVPDDWKENSIVFIKSKLNDLFESYDENLKELQLLQMFKKHIDDNELDINDFNPYKNGKE